ncbi:MAG: DMT family transporter [Mediterranea sp.]|jgi:drug/metabolite transporter (DMT)-like permease|nr:DMT family transporter [Mediterranea sp.]
MTNKLKGHVAILTANIIFGLNISVTKALLSHWMTPLGLMASRVLGAVLIFWLISLLVPKEKVVPRDMWLIALGGITGFVISQYCTASSLTYTTPVYFSLIMALTPVVVMLLSALFLKEPISRQKVFGVGLGVAGAALLMLNATTDAAAGRNNLIGILLAIGSILAWAVYLIITRTISQKYSIVTQMKWTFLFSGIVLLPLGASEFSQQTLYSAAWGWEGIAQLAFVLLLATIMGYFLMPFAMKYLRATTVSVYMNFQPVVASVVAIGVGQDVFSWDKPLSALLVLTGAFVVANSPAKGEGLKKD